MNKTISKIVVFASVLLMVSSAFAQRGNRGGHDGDFNYVEPGRGGRGYHHFPNQIIDGPRGTVIVHLNMQQYETQPRAYQEFYMGQLIKQAFPQFPAKTFNLLKAEFIAKSPRGLSELVIAQGYDETYPVRVPGDRHSYHAPGGWNSVFINSRNLNDDHGRMKLEVTGAVKFKGAILTLKKKYFAPRFKYEGSMYITNFMGRGRGYGRGGHHQAKSLYINEYGVEKLKLEANEAPIMISQVQVHMMNGRTVTLHQFNGYLAEGQSKVVDLGNFGRRDEKDIKSISVTAFRANQGRPGTGGYRPRYAQLPVLKIYSSK